MRNGIRNIATAILGFALLEGCASLRSEYAAPNPDLAAGFAAESDLLIPDPVQTNAWWQAFDDPVLDELVDDARRANGDLRASLARISAARERVVQTSRDRFPDGGLVASRMIDVNGDDDERVAGYETGWDIDLFGRLANQLRAAEARLEASEARLEDLEIAIVAATARTYFELRGAEDRLRLLEAFVIDQQAVADVMRVRFDEGQIAESDLSRALAQLAADRAALLLEQERRTRLENALAVLLAETPGQWRIPGHDGLRPLQMREVAIGDPAELMRRRPDVRAAERELAASNADIAVARSRLFPQVRLNGAFGYVVGSGSSVGDDSESNWSLMPTVSWPLFDLRSVRASIRASHAEAEAALAEYEQTVLRVLAETENAFNSYGIAQARLVELVRQAEHARRAAEVESVRYEEGAYDYLGALDAARTARLAEAALVDGLVGQRAATIAVHEALGWALPR